MRGIALSVGANLSKPATLSVHLAYSSHKYIFLRRSSTKCCPRSFFLFSGRPVRSCGRRSLIYRGIDSKRLAPLGPRTSTSFRRHSLRKTFNLRRDKSVRPVDLKNISWYKMIRGSTTSASCAHHLGFRGSDVLITSPVKSCVASLA